MNPFQGLSRRAPVVAHLIGVNAMLLAVTFIAERMWHLDLVTIMGLHYPLSDAFRPHQVFTHMFMHGGITHLLFNMFALFMFGSVLEQVFGARRFLFYYLFTGLGAAALHLGVTHFEIVRMRGLIGQLLLDFTPDTLSTFVQEHFADFYRIVAREGLNAWFASPGSAELATRCEQLVWELLQVRMDVPMVGASGAVFGLLLGFGVLFPNQIVQLLFPPVAMRAKWFVLIYGALELAMGLYQPGGSVAHFAHLGGMLFGWILLLIWRRHARV